MKKLVIPNVEVVNGICTTCVALLENVKKTKEEMEAAQKRYYDALNAYRDQRNLLHDTLPLSHDI